MHKRLKRLILASIVTGVLIVGFLVVDLALGRGWVGSRGHRLLDPVDLTTPWGFLGRVMIALLMLAVPTAHIAWLVTAAIWLARSTGSSQAGEMVSCPHCGGKVRANWKACPHCGERLGRVSNAE